MFKLLKTVFKTGDATTKYPFKPYEVDDDFRGKPELNSDQCIVCAACTMTSVKCLDYANRPDNGRAYMVVVPWSLYFLRTLRRGLPNQGHSLDPRL